MNFIFSIEINTSASIHVNAAASAELETSFLNTNPSDTEHFHKAFSVNCDVLIHQLIFLSAEAIKSEYCDCKKGRRNERLSWVLSEIYELENFLVPFMRTFLYFVLMHYERLACLLSSR